MVQAAAMFTASQFRQAEFKWFSGRRGVLRCRGFCGAREVRVHLHSERTLVVGVDAASRRHGPTTIVVDVLLRKRTIGADGCAGEQG